jgi:hypothetical protein
MTDTDNVMPLRPVGPRRKDPTNGDRQKRFRQRQKERRRNVTAPTVTTVQEPLPTVTEPIRARVISAPSRQRSCAVTFSATVSALALATVSAGFSITGMTAIFVGSFWPVIAMGVALELGKLSTVAWLGRYRGTAPWRLRTALVVLVGVLMALNAIGAYGFLAKAHIGHAVDGDTAMAGVAAEIDANVALHTGIVADLDRRIAQIDGAVEKATAKGRASSAMALADQQRKARTELVAQRTAEAKALAGLRVERAKAEGARRKVEADVGPVRYLATLLGAKDDDVLRYFILAVALLLDPAAVLLLMAATRRNENSGMSR